MVTEVESEGLGDVRAFTIRSQGETYRFDIDPDHDYGFNLDHLNEHRTSGDPVRVRWEERDDGFVAREIEDV